MKFKIKSYLLKLKLYFFGAGDKLSSLLTWLNSTISLAVVAALIYIVGFKSGFDIDFIIPLCRIAFIMFFVEYTFNAIRRIFFKSGKKHTILNIIIYASMYIFVIINLLPHSFTDKLSFLTVFTAKITLLVIVTIESFIQTSAIVTKSLNYRMSPNWIFVGSFAFMIFLGTGLLMLPKATVGGISFIDALFTSVSCVCVTGLSVVDTATQFTSLGHAIHALLIQSGGIGIMTFTSFFGLMFTDNASSHNKMLIKDIVDPEKSINQIFGTLRNILIVTFVIEGAGTWLIFEAVGNRSLAGLGDAAFHAISAFCNAGFSTFQNGLYNEALRTNCFLLNTISWLIILGGIGFPIIFNAAQWIKYQLTLLAVKITDRKDSLVYRTHVFTSNSLIVLIITGVLLVSGTVIFFLIEKNNTMEGMTLWEKFTTSFFMSVTPRTAGFNSFDMNALRPITITWMLLFMWIGASPMSTGGGIKTTTLGISLLTVWNTLRGRDYIEIRGRRISQQTINRSYIIIFVSLIVIGIGTGAVLLTEPAMNLQEAAFHVTSAFGTVGLSLTSEYTVPTKIILIIIMFIGRIGLITILMCIIPTKQISPYKYPTENISIN